MTNLFRMNISYVNELLQTGTNECKTHSDDTLERFGATRNQQAPFTFAGMYITESDKMYHIDQEFFMSKIEQIPSDAEFIKPASMRINLALYAKNRPDIVFQISQIAQVTQAMYERDVTKHCKRLK